MGECPSWYALYVAARWLGVTPDWLERQPKQTMLRAIEARNAEIRNEEGPTQRPAGGGPQGAIGAG